MTSNLENNGVQLSIREQQTNLLIEQVSIKKDIEQLKSQITDLSQSIRELKQEIKEDRETQKQEIKETHEAQKQALHYHSVALWVIAALVIACAIVFFTK